MVCPWESTSSFVGLLTLIVFHPIFSFFFSTERDGAVLFSDIVTFTEIASQSSPDDIVNMLNSLYTYFDELTVKNQVYKVTNCARVYLYTSSLCF
jgi:hypothetical protein